MGGKSRGLWGTESDATFDDQWNVDTGGIYRPNESEVCGENWAHGVRYQAVNAKELQSDGSYVQPKSKRQKEQVDVHRKFIELYAKRSV